MLTAFGETGLNYVVVGFKVGGRIPFTAVIHGLYFRLKERLAASKTGLHRRVDHRPLNSIAEPRYSEEGVLLRMNTNANVVCCSRFVFFPIGASTTTAFFAVFHTFWGAVVARGDDPVVEDK